MRGAAGRRKDKSKRDKGVPDASKHLFNCEHVQDVMTSPPVQLILPSFLHNLNAAHALGASIT